jgi:RNA polymerase sigma factor (sigma-70 family)
MEQAFIEIINRNRGTIYKVCNLYCQVDENRKDLVQEIILQLWKSFPSFRKESNINTWVYRVALNTAISNFRRESKRPINEILSEELFQLPDIQYSAEEKEKLDLLKQAINQLTAVEKAVIMLYLDDKTYDEIAEIMGITNSNVGVRLNRIKSKLSKIIQTEQS